MSSNICGSRFGRSVQLVPKTLEVWREKVKRKHGYMWSLAYPINSSYKYVKKVKLNPNSNPNISSEIIELQENGGSGGIQAQIPNCTLYIGIAAKCNEWNHCNAWQMFFHIKVYENRPNPNSSFSSKRVPWRMKI